ncbi:hypothetical protein NDU88_005428 [Pleurodeles waltl]|uniref:Uncharacterized protein n=1 Tax=Pleurodeles waltl TaxID=8319 RepID=A0AAV7PII3_PLEWA|nr:hypothetical protein NDU88_005428 [Pleurodeles waltl]
MTTRHGPFKEPQDEEAATSSPATHLRTGSSKVGRIPVKLYLGTFFEVAWEPAVECRERSRGPTQRSPVRIVKSFVAPLSWTVLHRLLYRTGKQGYQSDSIALKRICSAADNQTHRRSVKF